MTTREYTSKKHREAENGEAEYLRILGERIREARARRGMTRKILARDSAVSERYLAQLEAGIGQHLDRALAPNRPCDGTADRRSRARGTGPAGRTHLADPDAEPAFAPGTSPGAKAADEKLRHGRRKRAPPSHRPHRLAGRRQIDAGRHAGQGSAHTLYRTRPRNRARSRRQSARDFRSLRPGRLPPLRAARAGERDRAIRSRRHRHRRQHRVGSRRLSICCCPPVTPFGCRPNRRSI